MRCVFFILICLSAAIPCTARIITVDDDGLADFNNIQAAIDAAVEGDTVIVAEGRYVENITFNGRNITLTSTDPCNPDVVAATIIDGNQNGSVVTFNSGEDANCVLNGFTITNGNAEHGGGIYCENSRPTITNCSITRNTARHFGGGIICRHCCWPPGSPPPPLPPHPPPECNLPGPKIANCIISSNTADVGGGICCEGSMSTITNSTITFNSAVVGAGIFCCQSSPTISNCTIGYNSSQINGGGMTNRDHSFPDIKGCLFIANSAKYAGGMENSFNGSPSLTNCLFSDNWAEYGGGIDNYSSNPILTNCTFSRNLAQADGGGMSSYGGSKPMLANCIFWRNTDKGGGDESAQIHGGHSNLPVVNYSCIQGWTGRLGGSGNIRNDPCFVDLGYWNSNDTPQDPRDDVWIEGNYHLLPDSPCINAGDPNYIAESNETDLDGNPRVIGCRIDMGVFEYMQLVPAEVRIVPHTINMANQRKWITCYIYLPEAYNVADIDLCVVLLEYEIEPEQFWVNEKEQVVIAKFSHEQLQGILDIGEVELTISVQLMDGTVFEGTDIIRVIYEGGGKLAKLEASNPNPTDGAGGVNITTDLSWTAGYSATSHDVYFGTSSPPPFVCNQTAATFDPGTMVYSTKYYWRVDEVNKWGKTTGQVWSFTTMRFPPHPPPPPPPPQPPP